MDLSSEFISTLEVNCTVGRFQYRTGFLTSAVAFDSEEVSEDEGHNSGLGYMVTPVQYVGLRALRMPWVSFLATSRGSNCYLGVLSVLGLNSEAVH
jgi:hypothetical protein